MYIPTYVLYYVATYDIYRITDDNRNLATYMDSLTARCMGY